MGPCCVRSRIGVLAYRIYRRGIVWRGLSCRCLFPALGRIFLGEALFLENRLEELIEDQRMLT